MFDCAKSGGFGKNTGGKFIKKTDVQFLKFKNVRTVHLEVTTKCNAGCPMCLRTKLLENSDLGLPAGELSLADAKRIFPKDFLHQLDLIYMCGNLGDAAAAKDIVEICKYFRKSNSDLNLQIFTNGGLRTPKWWKDFAPIVKCAHFSVDGLKDTNHIYRKKVDFKKVIANMKGFIAGGGEVTWDFLVFSHNQHQVEEARALAKELGVHRFVVKASSRFSYPDFAASTIREPEVSGYKNKFVSQDKNRSYEEKMSVDVKCRAQEQKGIYVSAYGQVYPCCWVGSIRHMSHTLDHFKMSALAKAYGERFPDAFQTTPRKGVEAVLEGKFFEEALVRSWGTEIQLETCGRFCGANSNAHDSQWLSETPTR